MFASRHARSRGSSPGGDKQATSSLGAAPFATERRVQRSTAAVRHLPSRGSCNTAEKQPPQASRFYSDGTIVQRHGDYTQTGDFFPALQQLAGTTWQQIAAGGPDAYKVDCVKIEKLWRDWFEALYTSAMEQGYADYLLSYLAREVHGEWRLGANASGVITPKANDGSTVPLVTPETFKTGALATPKSRTLCLYTDGIVMESRSRTATWVARGRRTPRPASTLRHRCHRIAPQRDGVRRWPPAICCSRSTAADDAITTPAIKAIAQLSGVGSRPASTAHMCVLSR